VGSSGKKKKSVELDFAFQSPDRQSDNKKAKVYFSTNIQ